jgi:hypothetical protein
MICIKIGSFAGPSATTASFEPNQHAGAYSDRSFHLEDTTISSIAEIVELRGRADTGKL